MLVNQIYRRPTLVLALFAIFVSGAFSFTNLAASEEVRRLPKTHYINIGSTTYSVRTLRIRRGDTVVWRNRDVVPHTATGKGFDSGKMKRGARWRFTFRKKGNFPYVCVYHPMMKGRIIVR